MTIADVAASVRLVGTRNETAMVIHARGFDTRDQGRAKEVERGRQ
jgi:hypothetical protein